MLKELLAIVPVNGRKISIADGQEQEWLFPVEQLHIGDVVRVFPGERVPLDGIIIKGSSELTSNAITRVSVISRKNIGDTVACGVVNCSSVIDVKVTAEASVSSLQAKIKSLQMKSEESSWWERLLSNFRLTEGQNI